MPEDTTDAGGRAGDVSADTDGRDTDLSSPSSRPSGEDPHRAFGSATPGEGAPSMEGDPEAASGPTEGTPEDLKPGGDRFVDEEAGADAGDHGRETAP
jgi:hypothetical protein